MNVGESYSNFGVNNMGVNNMIGGVFNPDMSVVELWRRIEFNIQATLSPAGYDAWIKVLNPYRVIDGQVVLVAPDAITRDTVRNRYIANMNLVLRGILRADAKAPMDFKVIVAEELGLDGVSFAVYDENAESKIKANLAASNLIHKYTFDTFVKGKSNELAFAASVAVSDKPGLVYNPLFLYGGVGLGKTHLIYSIGNAILDSYPLSRVMYVSSEHMVNEFIAAIKEKTADSFIEKYRSVDVLLIDDIQFICGKVETQEMLFHTFNALYHGNKQIVLTSDRHPKDLKDLEERLVSRFSWGLTADLTVPDLETRAAILQKKAQNEGYKVPNDILHFLARSVSSNIRELEGALTTMMARARFMNRNIDIELAEIAVKELKDADAVKVLTIESIQEVVAAHCKLSVAELTGKKRTAEIALARQIAMYITHMLLDSPLAEIGAKFGGRDHTTVIHACNKISKDMEDDGDFKNEVEGLVSGLRQ